MKSLSITFMLFFACVMSLYAHDFKGRIVSSKNEAVENAAVYNQNSGKHTHTD